MSIHDADDDRYSGGALLRLPGEPLCHVARFLGLADLACAARTCSALRDAVAPELRGEREARARLASLSWVWQDVFRPDVAADACRRWGLAPERPFAALARRAAVRLVVSTPLYTPLYGGCASFHKEELATTNRFFAERDAPVRRCIDPHCGPLPVMLPGETLCVRDPWGGEVLVPVRVGRMAHGRGRDCLCETRSDGRLSLRISVLGRYPEYGSTRLAVDIWAVAPCDADVHAELLSSSSDSAEAFRRARVRYAARLCETWGIPHGHVSLRSDGRAFNEWDMTDEAWEAARRYYERSGIPLSGMVLFVN